MNRYQRQIQFSGLGKEGQAKLAQARVALVGCGGLGSMLAQCMVRAGVGRLTIIDPDVVDMTNLHRQFLFNEADVKKKARKAVAAEKKLKRANSEAEVVGVFAELSAFNADILLLGHDLVLDGTDNMQARHIINDWCVKNSVPWIYGGAVGAAGVVMVVVPGKGPCLRCLYPEAEMRCKTVPTVETLGVINTTPAFIASLQATEAMKLLSGSSDLILALRIIDLWSGDYQCVSVTRDPQCFCCGQREF